MDNRADNVLNFKRPGVYLNINMSSYQYRNPHIKDKTHSWPSYLQHGNPYTLEIMRRAPAGCLSMSTYQCRDSCHKDKKFSWLSYLYNGNLFTLLKILKGTVMIFVRCVHRVNFIIFANVLKQLCRAFYQIMVLPKISAKISWVWGEKTHLFP